MSLFYKFKDSAKIEEIVMPWPSDDYTIPAGKPISLTGIATGSDAVGILASDEHFPFTLPKSLAPTTPKEQAECKFAVITGGVVNLTSVENSAGELSDEVKNALSEIIFIEETDPSFGSCDWNTMENKPFGEEVEILHTFECEFGTDLSFTNTRFEEILLEGSPCFTVVYGDNVIKADEPKKGKITDYSGNTTDILYYGNREYYSKIVPNVEDNDTSDNYLLIIKKSRVSSLSYDFYPNLYIDGELVRDNFTLTMFLNNVEQIDEKFIPETIARKSDIAGGGGANLIFDKDITFDTLAYSSATHYKSSEDVDLSLEFGKVYLVVWGTPPDSTVAKWFKTCIVVGTNNGYDAPGIGAYSYEDVKKSEAETFFHFSANQAYYVDERTLRFKIYELA